MSSKIGTFLYRLGIAVMSAVLLAFVVATSLFMMKNDTASAVGMALLALVSLALLVVMRGRRAKKLARRRAASPAAPPTSAPRAVVTVQTEAWFIRESGERTPLGESFDVLVDY